MKRKQLHVLISAALLSAGAAMNVQAGNFTPQTTAFTYQGQLNAGGNSMTTGQYQFTFTLYDAVTGGNQVGSPIQMQVQVINGLFTADLDFGLIFNDQQYWLDIQVGTTTGNEQSLLPRQPVNTVPVAQYAMNAGNGAGATGAQGPQGPQGDVGAQGPIGPQGDAGVQGPIGPQGNVGPQGAPGNDGAQGTQGADGAQGAQGAQGDVGATGQGFNFVGPYGGTGATYAAYDVVTENGSSYVNLNGANTGDPATDTDDWSLMAQAGAQGAQGVQGAQGSQGVQGIQGVPGSQGAQGAQGAVGAQGPQGDVGAQGVQGPQGTQGATGATGTGSGGLLLSSQKNANDGDFIGVGETDPMEANVQQIVAVGGHFTALAGYFNSTMSKTVTFTLRINGVDTTLNCAITASTAKTCSTTGASIAFNAGDLVDVRVNTSVPGKPSSVALIVGP